METSTRRWILALALLVLTAGAALVLGPFDGPAPTAPGAGDSIARPPQEATDQRTPARAERPEEDDGDAEDGADTIGGFGNCIPEATPDAWKGEARIVVRSAVDHAPVRGAIVRSIPDDDSDAAPREVTTDDSGAASAPRWTGGTRAIVRKRGFLPARIEHLPRISAEPTVVELTPAPPLEGRVVYEGGGTPLAGATVMAWTGDYDKEFDDPVTTDADGRFEFVGVPADAAINVSAVAPGFAPRTVTSVPADARAPLRIVVGDGASISGTVRDAAGRPVAEAMVFVHDAREPPPLPRADLAQHERFNRGYLTAHSALLVSRARTDADGRWRVAGVPAPDAYVVYARRAVDVGRDDEGRSPEIVLASNERRDGVDVVVAATATIRVTVATPDGVHLVDKHADVTLDGARREVPREHDLDLEEGFALFERVFPGRHTIFVDADGFPAAKSEVVVAAGSHAEVTIRLTRGAEIRGRIVDDAGAPIVANAHVGFAPASHEDGERYVHGRIEPDGTFVIPGLTAGVGDVSVHAKGFVATERRGVAAGADLGSIVLRRSARVVGVVPAALRGRKLTVGSHAYDGLHGGSSSGVQTEDGRFERGDLPPDTPMEFYVAVEGAAPIVLENVVLRSGETRDLGELKFPDAVELAGVVLGADGAPVRGAVVDCSESWAPDGQQRTDAEGRFRIPGLIAKHATFCVEATGYPRTWIEIDVRQMTAPVSIRLARGGVLRGRVAAPEGTRLPERSHIDALPLGADGKPVEYHYHEIELDSLGAFQTQLPAGRYVVGFHRGRPPTEPLTVDVTEDGTTDVVLKLAK